MSNRILIAAAIIVQRGAWHRDWFAAGWEMQGNAILDQREPRNSPWRVLSLSLPLSVCRIALRGQILEPGLFGRESGYLTLAQIAPKSTTTNRLLASSGWTTAEAALIRKAA
jgi:hypothetical protein